MVDPNITQYKYCPVCSSALVKKEIENKIRPTCPNCAFVYWSSAKPTTSVILTDKGKILFLKRNKPPLKNYWVLPGGYLEYDEIPQATIIRETKEEIGCQIKLISLVGIYLIDNDPRGNSLDIIYYGEIVSGNSTISEHGQLNFFSPNKLPELIGYKHRQAIGDWLKVFGKP